MFLNEVPPDSKEGRVSLQWLKCRLIFHLTRWRDDHSSSVYSCHLFLIFSASVRSIQFMSFIVPIFAWNVPLVSLIFLKRPLVFPILLFSYISLHWSLRKVFLLSLLFFGTLHSNGYSFPFFLLFLASLLFTAICKGSSASHFAILHFFFLGMVLVPVSCTVSRTFVHSSSGSLSGLVP